MNGKKRIDSSCYPDIKTLQALSVKIICINENEEILEQGTGTLFANDGSYYVITAAHCIQFKNTQNHYDITNIRITLIQSSEVILEVNEVLDFNLDDKIDFALLSVKFDIDRFYTKFDYENDICFVCNDENVDKTCIYSYTKKYPSGRQFQTRMVSPDTYVIEDNISATGIDLYQVMKGSSGSGIFVEYGNRIYCLGYVKGRRKETDILDDIIVHRIPSEINKKLPYLILRNSIQQENSQGQFISTHSYIESNYIDKWNELNTTLLKNEDASGILNEIDNLRTQNPYVKSVICQEQLTNTILRKKNQWNACEQRAFIYALQDRGLWPTLFGELPQAGDLEKIPEYKNMMLRASTFDSELTDETNIPDRNTDEGMYELVIREAFKFDFKSMLELINNWKPVGVWIVKKVLFKHLFDKDDDILNMVKSFMDNSNNSANERYVATFIYNIASQRIPQPYNYRKFLMDGKEGPSELISYISGRIDKTKVQPQIFGTHSTEIWGSTDSISFPESIRLLQYLANTGLTTKFGFYNIVNIEHWMKAFRHLVHFIPYPTVYYTLQYAEEKTVRWAGQMIAYSDDNLLTSIRPNLINALLRALGNECTPKNLVESIFYITQELYVSVDESVWYEEFRKSVLVYFIEKIDAAKVSMSDAIYKNLFSAIQCIKDLERRKEVFINLSNKMSQNPRLISNLLCKALLVDSKLATTPEVEKCLWNIINQFPIIDCYHILYEFNRVNTLTTNQRKAIDEKIIKEQLSFSKRDYIGFVNLSYLALTNKSITEIKQNILVGDIWNCGISNSSYTAPMPSHIERFDNKVIWTEKEWHQIKLNMEKNIDLIENERIKGEFSNYFNYMYLNLLVDMKLFIVKIQETNGFYVEDILLRIDTNIKQLSKFENLIESLSSDDNNEVNVSLDLLNIKLKTDDFDKYKSEINLIINKVVLKQSANIGNCINFLAFLMEKFPVKMKKNFGDLLLCLLKNYISYDFESMNFRVPNVNHNFSLIAHNMEPEFKDMAQVKYWLSDEVVNRFGGFTILPNKAE